MYLVQDIIHVLYALDLIFQGGVHFLQPVDGIDHAGGQSLGDFLYFFNVVVGLSRQAPYFIRNHGESPAGFTAPACFYGCIQCQKACLGCYRPYRLACRDYLVRIGAGLVDQPVYLGNCLRRRFILLLQ